MANKSPIEQNVVKSDSDAQNQTFETIGKQVEQLALDETPLPAGFEGRAVPTEVLDSLCMNCGKDVCFRLEFMNSKFGFSDNLLIPGKNDITLDQNSSFRR